MSKTGSWEYAYTDTSTQKTIMYITTREMDSEAVEYSFNSQVSPDFVLTGLTGASAYGVGGASDTRTVAFVNAIGGADPVLWYGPAYHSPQNASRCD